MNLPRLILLAMFRSVSGVPISVNLWRMALAFLRKQFDGCELRFLPLFYRSEIFDKDTNQMLLWHHRGFSYDQKRIDALHLVHYSRFPYDKNL